MFVRRLTGFQNSWPHPRRSVFPPFRHQKMLLSPPSIQSRYLVSPIEARPTASAQDATADIVPVTHRNGPTTGESGQLRQNDSQAGQIANGAPSDRLRTHQFDTYKLVSALQSAGYTRPQAIALMKCLRTVLVNGTDFAKSHYLSRGDLENVHSLICRS